jgi:hypothetical protein
VADDSGAGGVRKYSLVGGNWTATGVVGAGDAYRGVTGVVSGSTVTLYAVRGANQLVTISDASGYNGTLTGTAVLRATAGTNTAFRGVALTPESLVTRAVSLSVSANSTSESTPANTITVTVTASGPVSGAQTVNLTVSGTVTGSDYTLSSSTVTIPNAGTQGSVTLTIVDDAVAEGNETLTLALASPSSGITIGSPATQSIVIADNDAQSVTLSASAASGSESAGSVITLTATASAPVSSDQTVGINVAGAGITAGDYSLSGTVITIPNGATTGSVTLTIVDDTLVEPTETATVTLVSPSTGLVLGSPSSVAISIFDNDAPSTRIYEIQGARHYSRFHGQVVSNVPGIVTAVSANGFFMQDETGDGDPTTSDAIFVFTSSAPAVTVGSRVEVTGEVFEFRPECSSLANNLACVGTDDEDFALRLTLTEIGRGGALPTVVTVAAGPFPLPAPVIMGAGGRPLPTSNVSPNCAAAGTNLETTAATLPCPFEPSGNALDYFESLEGMRVRVVNPVATSGFVSFDEFWVLADNGAGATGRNARGGITISAGDMNPERILLNLTGAGTGAALAGLNTGARWTGNFDGILNYSFGDYKVDLPDGFAMPTPDAGSNALPQETTTLAGTSTQLTVASFNVENLAGNAAGSKYAQLAAVIANRMGNPDIVALMEIQDNNGERSGSNIACPASADGTVSASTTFANLVAAITTAGGAGYQFTQIDPQDCTDGGAPTGNIRVGFLYNPARVGFTPVAGGGTTVANSIVNVGGEARLAQNPGRIDPANAAFTSSRKPLAAEFTFNGQRFIAIANHWNSKGGDYPEHGRFQPPLLTSEAQRSQIAAVVKGFVQSALDIDPGTRMVILGDLNDFPFSPPVTSFKATTPPLAGLVDTLPAGERYSYNFRGNSQVLDHIIVTPALAMGAQYDVVHANSEYRNQISDHDPEVALLDFALPSVTLSVSAASAAEAAPASTVTVTATASRPVSGAQSVQLVTGGTASAADYALSARTIAIAAGATSGSVTLTIVDDTEVEAAETVTLTLATPSAGLTLGVPATQTVTIVDNDVAPVPLAPPGPPTGVAATAGNAQATVTFAAPASNGGSAITGYTVVSNPAGGVDINAGTTSLSHVVVGLANGTAYTFTGRATNAIGTGAPSAASNSVTPVANTFTGTTATSGTASVSFIGGGATCSFAPAGNGPMQSAFFIPVSGHPKSPPAGTAPAVAFPYGLLDFVLVNCTPGATVTFTVTYPAPLPGGTQYFKYGPTPGNPTAHWYVLPATIAGNVATFTITDGALGDDDLASNGTIVDQGGPGGPVGGAGGALPVPTLSEWMMALLAGLLAVAGFAAMRRRA